ncbi:ATP-binding protein [Cohnella faecalis]|uniref:histidine kinase n=1 Tax=Cohnella faecalis TaxID=2315694 RepID=A0A398CD39_9BACL|nr:ATP-binding protein [Cohnella faecalis]RIE00630.1 hypothetical protein D3H35_27065 [Cohnella faecalis]
MKSRRKHRSFTAELLGWIVLLVVLPVGLFLAYFYVSSTDNTKRMEEEKARLTNRSAQKSIESLGDSILGVTVTNGYWEQSRQALLNDDKEWLQINIGDMPSIVPNIDFAAAADLNGDVLVQSGDIAELKVHIGFPFLLDKLRSSPTFTGVLDTSRGLALIAASIVTDETGKEPTAGYLVTGRLLEDADLRKVQDTLQADVSVLLNSGQFLTSDSSSERSGMQAMPEKASIPKTTFQLQRIEGSYQSLMTEPFLDMAGHVIGAIRTQSVSVSSAQAADNVRTLSLYAIGILMLLIVLVVYLLRRRIVLPLRHFTASLEEVAAGRKLEKMPKQVLQADAEIVEAIQQIADWNQLLERTVRNRTADIRTLLDHTRHGILSVGPELKVKEEYSVECVRLFEGEPGGLPIAELLYPHDEQEASLMQAILSDYFAERDEFKRDMIFSLLPDEMRINGRTVKAEYIPLSEEESADGSGESVMLLLTDLTETRDLESKMQQERRVLEMVVQSVTHPEDYANIVRDFESFRHTEIRELMASDAESPQEKAMRIYRMVHTFKGSFGFLRFVHIIPRLHELETDLLRLMDNDSLSLIELTNFLRGQRLEDWLQDDMEVLRSVLGPAYEQLLLEHGVKLDKEQWSEIESMLDQTLQQQDDRIWLEKFRTWRYKKAETLFRPYSSYLQEMAERNGILLHPVELKGGEIPVDPEHLYGFARSFVHVVRNAVVHGIEPPDERAAQGKDEYGTVSFSVERVDGNLLITFEDDGRGIDADALIRKARQQGLETEELTEEEALGLIFEEKLSTSQQVTEWSGRGVGLSVVKEEVEQLGGTIEIRTKIGAGTSFVFTLPEGSWGGDDRIGA